MNCSINKMTCKRNVDVFPQWLFYLILMPWLCFASCPPEEDLAPRCYCMDMNEGGSLICKNIFDPLELRAPVEATIDHKMAGMTILNSTLRYLPHDLFRGTEIPKIQFTDIFLMSLSDSDLAFEGLENHLVEIRASGTNYISQWDFSQLRNMKKMNLIDIHSINIETMSEELPEFPELKFFGLGKANLTDLSDHAFAKCPQLQLISLSENKLSTLKRSMLPNPANHLSLINLQSNQLSILPDDFFTEMPVLKDVYLEDNQFVTLDEKVFSDIIGQLSTLSMTSNPFTCDCRLIWLTKKRKPMWFNANCVKPLALAGSDLKYLEPRELRC